MDTTSVSYCCISKGGRVLYTYVDDGDPEVENLAASCLGSTPPYHRWYFQTNGKKTFGFLMDDEYVYFAIVNQSLGHSSLVVKFLEKFRDEFVKIAKKKGSTSTRSLQEPLLRVIRNFVSSLEHVSGSRKEWPARRGELTPSPSSIDGNGQFETNAPLLGRATKQEKRKMKDHVVSVRDTEMKEHRRSTDGDSSNDQGKNSEQSSSRNTSRAKWCRQVRIVLAIDAVICIVLLVIWLVICRGTECIR